MKTSAKLLSILVICLLAVSLSVSVADTASFSREFKDIGQSYSPTDKRFSFDVTATVQTEPNGTWAMDKTYQVTYSIKIAYVNETLYNPDTFILDCYDSGATPYQSEATVQNDATLTFNVTADSMVKTYGIDKSFSFRVYGNGDVITSGGWYPSMLNESIPVNVVDKPTPTLIYNSSNLTIDTLYVAMICIFLIVIAVVGIIAYRLGIKNRKVS